MKKEKASCYKKAKKSKKGGPNTAGSCTKRIRRQNKERR